MLDKYEIRARIIPGILLCIPVLISVAAIGLEHFGWLKSLLSGAFMTMVLSYGLSMLIRPGGVKLQESLYEKWGGSPSTRFLRWSDNTLSDQKKNLIHKKIKTDFKLQLLSRDEERQTPDQADRVINDAFDSIRDKIRANKKGHGLWQIHNIEYGFYRNFLGSWQWGLIMALLGALVLIFIYYLSSYKDNKLSIAACLDFSYAIILLLYVRHYGENNLKHASEQYVTSALEAYLSHKSVTKKEE